jgi:hypothetical protein
MFPQPDTQFWLERGLDASLELAEQYGLSKQARTLRIQGQSIGYAQAVAESNIFVNAEGVAAKGTRVTATGFSASTLSVTDEGTRLLSNPYELIPDSSRLSGSLSTEARMLTAGNAAEAAIVQNLDATLTVTTTTSRALGQAGKILGGPIGGAALGAGLSYYENAGKVDQTRLEVGLWVDAAFGAANAAASGAAGVAAAGATSVSGPVAIGIGVVTATAVGAGLDYAFKGATPFNGMSARDVVVNSIIDYGIPAYQQAKTYANEYYDRYRLWR